MCNGGFMSGKSIKYLEVLEKVKEKKISQEQAAEELNISIRQTYRIYKKFLKEGAGGFLSKKTRQTKQSSAIENYKGKNFRISYLRAL